VLDTSARLLRLLAVLPTRPAWTGPDLADRLDVTDRTLRRDMARLRELGYPVVAVPGVGGGYRLTAGSTLPPLLLDDEEAVAVVLSLRTAASQGVTGIAETSLRALAKLERILPARLRMRTSALRTATVPLTNQATTVAVEDLSTIAEACQSLHRITFTYRDRDGRPTQRTVEPHRLVHTGRRWYLVARDQDRDGWRTFRVDRVHDLTATKVRFTPQNPPDAAAFVAESVTSAPYRYRARIRVYAPAAHLAEQVSPASGIVEALDEATSLLVTGADSLGFIAMHLALLGHHFAVIEPPELIDEIESLAQRLARAHGAST
jgi:predicted DNA-binding transcriptional regulator YafY